MGFSGYRASMKPLTGSSEEIAAGLRAFARAGVARVQLWLAPSTLAGIDAFAPSWQSSIAGSRACGGAA